MDALFESPYQYGFAHEKCRNLLVLSMESKARRRLDAIPDDMGAQTLMRVFERQADEVCSRVK